MKELFRPTACTPNNAKRFDPFPHQKEVCLNKNKFNTVIPHNFLQPNISFSVTVRKNVQGVMLIIRFNFTTSATSWYMS